MSRILFLSRWFPYPTDNGSKLRVYNLLRGLAAQHEVTLLSFADERTAQVDAPQIKSLCRQVRVVPWKPFDAKSLRSRLAFFSPNPRSVVDTFSPEMRRLVRQVLSTDHYDGVIASQSPAAAYAPLFHGLPAVFEEAEVGVLYEQFAKASSIRNRLRYGLTWAKQQHYLAGVLPYFRTCTVVSEKERHLIQSHVSDREPIEVIPNGVHLSEYIDVCKQPRPNTLIFNGSFRYFANHDAMVWFLKDIYPEIMRHVPNVHLTITGETANLPLPPADNVILTGQVDDVRPLIASAWTSLAPIRQGGGTRLKILEAMALRTPVVATSKGAEGLDARDDEHLLIADTPQAFAGAVIRLFNEPGLAQRLADKAFQLVREKYDWAVVMPRFQSLVDQVIWGSKAG
ncbi:MAG TPA: glycosyltransferase [Anaerolineae bacterium]